MTLASRDGEKPWKKSVWIGGLWAKIWTCETGVLTTWLWHSVSIASITPLFTVKVENVWSFSLHMNNMNLYSYIESKRIFYSNITNITWNPVPTILYSWSSVTVVILNATQIKFLNLLKEILQNCDRGVDQLINYTITMPLFYRENHNQWWASV